MVISVCEAQNRLTEILEELKPGEEVFLSDKQGIVAKIVKEARVSAHARPLGAGKDAILYMADDFDDPLEDFKENME